MQANNNHRYIVLALLFTVSLITGCRQSLAPDQYMDWVKDEANGLNKTKIIGDYKIRCQYKPLDYIILSEKAKNELVSKDTLVQRQKELTGMQYFDLYISHANGDLIKNQSSSETDFYNRMYYYSFGFANDIKLIEGNDTLACELYHFERDYDLAKEKRFLLGFESKGKSTEDKTLYIDSKVLGLAIVKIQIKNKDIQNIPAVKYENKN